MAIIVKPNTFVPGTIIRSAEVNDDFDTIYNDYNGDITNANVAPAANIHFGKLVATSGDATISDTGVITMTGTSSFLVPVGTIIPFYDFNGALTFNAAKWAYCNGQVIAVGSIGLQTLPDLSGRYMVGFGTDGGGDIGTAPFATPPVGNAGNIINIAHSHTVNAHDHSVPGLSVPGLSVPGLSVPGLSFSGTTGTGTSGAASPGTDTQGNHTHTAGSLQFAVLQAETKAGGVLGYINAFDAAGTLLRLFGGDSNGGASTSGWVAKNQDGGAGLTGAVTVKQNAAGDDGMFSEPGPGFNTCYTSTGSGSTGAGGSHSHTVDAHTHSVPGLSFSGTTGTGTTGTGTTGTGTTGTATTGSASPGTDSQLSTTQSIQPISIRVRFIMRIA